LEATVNRAALVIALALLAGAPLHGAAPAATVSLEEGFRHPPLAARPRALWPWINGNTDEVEITHEMAEARAKGMGGFDIWDIRPVVDEDKVVPAGQPFMGPASVKAIAHAVREATRLGLDLGLTIASGWNAGGSWTRPEHATMGLFRSQKEVVGPGRLRIDLPFPELPKDYKDQGPALIERDADGRPAFAREVAVLAMPVTADRLIPSTTDVIDLSGHMDALGHLDWDAPAGRYKVVRYVCANTGQPMISSSVLSNGPMIDHFNPEATEVHLRYFIDKLTAELGPLAKTALKYFYTDSYEVRGELWTPKLLEEFRRRVGYDMTPFLPTLDGSTVVDAETTARFRFDYDKLLSDLIIEGHYAKGKEVANRYGLGFVAEAAGPGQPIHNCPFESLKSSGALDVPRGEFWHHHTGKDAELLQVVKGVASASHIYEKTYVEAESFTSVWLWQERLADLRPTADRAFCEGLNRVYFHTFPHTPGAAGRPGWVYSFGTQISVTQPWWPHARPFMDYLARTSFLLQQGLFVGDVLYYYGDQAPNFVPPKHVDPSLGRGFDYDVTNSDVLLHRISVRDGRLVLPGGGSYAVLALPDDERMDPAVLAKIAELVEAGATVVGRRPTRAYGLNERDKTDAEVRRRADGLWGEVDGVTVKERGVGRGRVAFGKDLRVVLNERGIGPDVAAEGGADEAIDFIHRRTPEADLYFVRNTTDQPLDVNVRFRTTRRKVERWDPVTATISSLDGRIDGASREVRLRFDPNGSFFVVFRDGEPAEPSPPVASPPARTLPLAGDWQVTFPLGAATQKLTFPALASWTDSPLEAVRFFSGIATYRKTADLPALGKRRATLHLGRVEATARVFVNDQEAGTLWTPPFALDVTRFLRPGANVLSIEVANLWPNRLIGDAHLTVDKRTTHTNIKRLPNAWSTPMAELPSVKYGLLPSGLLGPVEIRLE
jgi:(4-O-methyl)-D-glucuronate---lignin esterase